MRHALPLTLAFAVLPAAGFAQDKTCSDEFAAIQKQIEGATLQSQYKGREASHPLVLQMANGETVDLSGTIITATPYESWTGSRPVVEKVGSYADEATPLIEAGDEEGCMGLLQQARADIKAFDQSDGDPNMSDNDQQDGTPEDDGNVGAAIVEEPGQGEPEAEAAEEPVESAAAAATGTPAEAAGADPATPAEEEKLLPEPSGEADKPN